MNEYIRRPIYDAIQIRTDNMEALRKLAAEDDHVQMTHDNAIYDGHRFPVQILTQSGWVGLMVGTWMAREQGDRLAPGFHWQNLSNHQFQQQFSQRKTP